MKTVSGANGPVTCRPSARAASMAGMMISISSRPNRPPSPACGLSPATPMRGARPSDRPTRLVRDAQRLQHVVEGHRLDRVAQGHVDADQHGAQFVVGQHHAHRHLGDAVWPSQAAASACSSSVWPGKSTPAAASASLCRGAVTSAAISPAQRRPRGPHDAVGRGLAGSGADLAPGRRLRQARSPAARGCSAAAAPAPPARRFDHGNGKRQRRGRRGSPAQRGASSPGRPRRSSPA